MASEYEPLPAGYGQALVRHDPRLQVWSAQSTITEADTVAGPATPDTSQSSGLRFEPSGVATSTDRLDVQVERGGFPGGGMALSWRRYDADPDVWYGWDPPVGVSYVEPANWGVSGVAGDMHHQPDAVTLPDGRVVVVSAENDSGDTAVRVLVRAAAGTWSTSAQLTETVRAYTSTSVTPWCSCWYEPPPSDRPDAPGYLRVAWLTYDEASETAQIAISECSEDDDPSDPADWRLVEPAALPVGRQVAAGAIVRIRARWSAGQVVLLLQEATALRQYASSDGLRFRSVSGTLDPLAGAWDIARIGPLLTLAYCTDAGSSVLKTASVGDAFSALANAVQVSVFGTGTIFADQASKVLICESAPGEGWLYLTRDDEAAEDSYAFQTLDGGRTWYGIGGDTSDGTTTTGPQWLGGVGLETGCAVGWRDRVLVLAETHDTGAYDGSLLCLHLGGYVDVSQPWRNDGVQQVRRWTWARTWIPTDAPGNVFNETLTGAVLAAWQSDASYRITTDAGEYATWDATTSGAYTDAARQVRAAVKVTSGKALLQARWSDGAASYGVEVQVTSTAIGLYDLQSHTLIGSAATASGKVEVKAAVYGSSAKAYWRQWAAGTPTAWNLLATASGTLSDSGVVDPYEGLTIDESSVVDTYCLSLSVPIPAAIVRHSGIVRAATWIATYGVDTVQHPGRPQGAFPLHYSHGLYLRAHAGPGRVGQGWSITPTASYPVTLAAVSSTYPSPRDGWLPPESGAQTVAYRLYDTTAEDCDTICDLWFLWIQTDAPTVAVSWNEGGTWGSTTTHAMYALVTGTRYGNTLVLDEVVTSTAGATFIERDELAGCYVYNSGGDALRIVSHTAGCLLADTDDERQTPIFTLDGVDGTESAVSGAWRIHYGQAVIPIVAPERARGIRVTEGAPTAIPAGGRRRSKHLLGPALLLGNPHHMDGSVVTRNSVTDTTTEDGRSWRRVPGVARRTVEVSWSTTQHFRRQIQATLADPAFIRPWAATGRASYSIGALAGEIAAVVREWASGPVLHVPSYVRSTQSTDPLVGHRARGCLLGWVDPTWTVEGTGGVEYRSDTVRPGSLRLVEVV